MIQHDHAITDAREIWANNMRHWLDVYKVSARQGDEVTESIALGKIESLSIEHFPGKHASCELAHDGIRIALKIAGYENVDSMTQFERASALLNMAQELSATRKPDIDNDSDIRHAFAIANRFGKVYKEMTA